MRRTLKAITVAGLASVMIVASIGSAFALVETPPETETTVDLDTVRDTAIERLGNRIERFGDVIEELADDAGPRATQITALLTDGVTIFEEALAAIPGAGTADEVRDIVREASEDFRAHARIRRAYAHVAADLAKFERRLEVLSHAISRAEEAGLDVTRAAAEAGAALDDLTEAHRLFDAVDPHEPGILEAIGEAHRRAHEAQRHIRSGFTALKGETLDTEAR